jgi:hypothetical protein
MRRWAVSFGRWPLILRNRARYLLERRLRVPPAPVWTLTHHVTIYNTPIHNILSTAPQLSISQKALGTLPEDGNVMPKHVGATRHN